MYTSSSNTRRLDEKRWLLESRFWSTSKPFSGDTICLWIGQIRFSRRRPATEPKFVCEEDDVTPCADAELGRDLPSAPSQFRWVGEQFLPKPTTSGRGRWQGYFDYGKQVMNV
jgi:hypothetical protein